jgi:PKD repeat protein
MNATNFFTRRMLGMDYRVWIAMLFVCFLSLGLYGYKQIRLTSMNGQPCTPDTITVNGKMVEVVVGCYLNRPSLFGVQSEAAATVEWNFRDGTPVEKERVVYHKFTQEGAHRVTVTVNGRCESDVLVQVSEDPFFSGYREKPVIEIYAEPAHPEPGNTVKFRCLTDLPVINSYEWKVLETKEVKKDSEPTFTFPDSRDYTIHLIINDDPLTETTSKIEVSMEMTQVQATTGNNGSGAGMPSDIGPLGNLVPPGGAPSNPINGTQSNNVPPKNDQVTSKPPIDTSKSGLLPKVVPEIDQATFKGLLQNVVDQEGKEPGDLYEYLYYDETTMVEVNGDSTSKIYLKDFCRNMRKKKKNMRKIESLSFQRDDTKNIQVIKVKVPERRFWDKLNPFN